VNGPGTGGEAPGEYVTQWSEPGTIGAEWELCVVDPQTGLPVPTGGTELIEAMDRTGNGACDWLHDELYQHTVEVVTPPHRRVAEIHSFFAEKLAHLRGAAQKRGWRLYSAGTHPWAAGEDFPTTPSPDREARQSRIPDAVRSFQIWSVHIHFGVTSGPAAAAAMRELHAHLPYFIALSASSPYWEGRDTGLLNWRVALQQADPDRREPPLFESWEEMNSHLQLRRQMGRLPHSKNLKWEIRPTPRGTVELRVCDAVSSLEQMSSLVALGQCLVARAEDHAKQGLPMPAVDEHWFRTNRTAAMQFGLGAHMVTPDGDTRRLRERIPELVQELLPYARKLGCVDELRSVQTMARIYTLDETAFPLAARQRRVVEASNQFKQAVQLACDELDQSIDRNRTVTLGDRKTVAARQGLA
jgi:glutamate---cysteine ligase / carboxylate-amine ligase